MVNSSKLLNKEIMNMNTLQFLVNNQNQQQPLLINISILAIGLFWAITTQADVNIEQNTEQSVQTARYCGTSTSNQSTRKTAVAKSTVFSQLQKEPLFKPGLQKKQQTACSALSSQSANQLRADRSAFLIDIRDNQAFQRYHIPGSLNIPVHTLKTKTFLKSKHLILLNEGHSTLETLCIALQQAGFRQISILQGGLNQWLKQIGPLPGNLIAQHNNNQITPAQFFKERDYPHWLVVNMASPNQRLSPAVLNLSPSDDNFVKQLTQAIAKRTETTGTAPYILIISTQGEAYPKVQAQLRNTDLFNVFYLQGGIQSYQHFIQQQAVMNTYIPGVQTATSCGKPVNQCQP